MKNKEYIQSQYNELRHCEDLPEAGTKPISKRCKIAVLLVNFGGPHNILSVKSFLYNLFSDPVILDFPFASLYRKSLAWLIANVRNKASSEMYKEVGGISPLIPATYLQKEKLQELFDINDLPVDVFLGFSYSSPFIRDVLGNLYNLKYEKIIVLPLYPQYSYTTTGSIENIVKLSTPANSTKVFVIKDWYKDEDYITGQVNLIKNALNNLDLRSTEIIFSAHSIPIQVIKNGDPYKEQITETVRFILEKLSWKKKWHISYQSKLGPIQWLEPRTDKVIEEIAKRNKNANVLVVPISFTSEHVETIFEIGVLYKEIARKAGIKRFMRVPALNTNKYLIQALYNQIIGCLENNQVSVKEFLLIK